MLFTILLGLVAGGPRTADAGVPLDPGTFLLAWDPVTLTQIATVPGFVTLNLYVVGIDIPEISAWEASVSIPPNWVVIDVAFTPPDALNVGSGDSYIVGLGQCMATDAPDALAAINLGYFAAPTAPADQLFCLGPSEPSSVNGEAPAYVDCNDQLLLGLLAPEDSCGCAPAGCAVANPTCPVATDQSSFGGFKANRAP